MKSLDEYLADAEQAHGHLCAGQVLGVRMAMVGLQKLGINDPLANKEDRKRLVTFVEIDRCATDAIGVVTGCRLGKRALKFRDWGKMAATFVDVSTGKAIRIAPYVYRTPASAFADFSAATAANITGQAGKDIPATDPAMTLARTRVPPTGHGKARAGKAVRATVRFIATNCARRWRSPSRTHILP